MNIALVHPMTGKAMSDRLQFGVDAPGVVRNLVLLGGGLLTLALASVALGRHDPIGLELEPGISCLASGALMLLSSRFGKRIVARRMIDSLRLRGDEQVLDVGCGRGLLLLEAARRLREGRATGVDLWSRVDQSGNAAEVTAANAARAGLAARVHIDTADMRALPYADASFDVAVSSLAIHNLPDAAARAQAIAEIVRVLKPGGRAALLDFRCTGDYLRALRSGGMLAPRRSWPILLMFPPVRIVRARKP